MRLTDKPGGQYAVLQSIKVVAYIMNIMPKLTTRAKTTSTHHKPNASWAHR